MYLGSDEEGHTVLGCLNGRMPCYSEGRCRVFLGYVFSRVWRGTCQRLDQTAVLKEKHEPYLLRCSKRLKRRPQVGIGHECDFWG